MAAQPSKYAEAHVFGVPVLGVQGVVMYDEQGALVTRFVVQLQIMTDPVDSRWETFAQIDHEPNNPSGHNLHKEGIHVDIYHTDRTTTTLHPISSGLPADHKKLMYSCAEYLNDHAKWFLEVADKQRSTNSPPSY